MRLLDKKRLSKLLLCSLVFLLVGMGKSGASGSTHVIVKGLFSSPRDEYLPESAQGSHLILNINGEEKDIGSDQDFIVNHSLENLTVTVAKQPYNPTQFCKVVKKVPSVTVACAPFLYSLVSGLNEFRLSVSRLVVPTRPVVDRNYRLSFGINAGDIDVFPDPKGDYLLIKKGDTIGAHPIDPISGGVSEAPKNSLPLKHDRRSLAFTFHPDGRYFYATSLSGGISAGRVNDGNLTPFEPGIEGGQHIASSAIDAGGKFAYLIKANPLCFPQMQGCEDSSTLYGYDIDQETGKFNNAVSNPTSIPSCFEYKGCQLVIDPTGRFVYVITKNGDVFVTKRVDNKLIVFNKNREKQRLEAAPFARIVHSPRSNLVYMMGNDSVLYCYTFEEDGTLKKRGAAKFERHSDGQDFKTTVIAVNRAGNVVFVSGFPYGELNIAQFDPAGTLIVTNQVDMPAGDIAVTQ